MTLHSQISEKVHDKQNEGISWSPTIWNLCNVGGSPDNSELISSNIEDKIEIKHIVTLKRRCYKLRDCDHEFQIFITPTNGIDYRSLSCEHTGSIIRHPARESELLR
ncbi:unnamed protein product [Lactuca virosa]|uniref:SP-RING-type domain-containing protein n=1 Tax=Lactuca virosa TaxID=75947 RepID=A0AAU9PLX5_9ASTR|nr:unnamed protein product [Lactuca virosa]